MELANKMPPVLFLFRGSVTQYFDPVMYSCQFKEHLSKALGQNWVYVWMLKAVLVYLSAE